MRNTILLAVLLLISIRAEGQKATFTTNSGLSIGFGAGTSYQLSDIKNSEGFGFDFVFGSNIYQKENAFLAVDWKFRFLPGQNKAYDHRINPDDTYSNIRYSFFTYDAELGLTLNRLRERTRIILTGFAGFGITHGRTFTDLYDENSNLYDYSVINSGGTPDQIRADLASLSDNDFETALSNKAAIMPTAGIYLGYQFSRSFSIGIEHKVNFSLKENNSAFGIDIDNNIVTGSFLDMNHYTSLGFRWNLRGGRASRPTSRPVYPPVEKSPLVYRDPIPSRTDTVIQHTKPGLRDSTILNRRAVTTRPLITTRTVTTNPPVTINPPVTTRPPVTTPPPITRPPRTTRPVSTRPVNIEPPQVVFINPGSPVTVEKNLFPLKAQTSNVNEWQDVEVKVNGRSNSNFSFTRDGLVSLNIGLREGLNTLEVTGKNDAGQVTEKTSVTYVRAEIKMPPSVRINIPGQSPYNTYESSEDIKALVTEVESRDDITVTINGAPTNSFNFDPASFALSMRVALREGRNTIVISAENEAGKDSESQVIIKEIKPCPAPVLKINEPQATTTENQTVVFKATTANVSRDQLSLTLNGNRISNFSFSANVLQYSANLVKGANRFVLLANNECGSESVSRSIKYTPPVIVEPPCYQPEVDFNVSQLSTGDATHIIKGTLKNVEKKSDITLTINGSRKDGFQFNTASGQITFRTKLNPGTHNIKVDAKNDCGNDSKTVSVTVEKPCLPPAVNFSLSEVKQNNVTHKLSGKVTNIADRNGIKISVNGSPNNSFTYSASTGILAASFNLTPGTYNIIVTVQNECGRDSKTSKLSIAEPQKPCGVRINPGNSKWEFCLVTPRGTYNRDNLSNSNFSYSGTATSLYIKPIAGGGDAIINGKPYTLRSGTYYLFTGNLKVTVSTKNPGAMGQWSVCITGNKAPVSGNGNNRPKSPCEEGAEDGKPKKPDRK